MASGMQYWYVLPLSLYLSSLPSIIMVIFISSHLLQVWALEMELIIGISRVSNVRFPALIRCGISIAWKRDLLQVHVHRERLNALTFDEVPAHQ